MQNISYSLNGCAHVISAQIDTERRRHINQHIAAGKHIVTHRFLIE